MSKPSQASRAFRISRPADQSEIDRYEKYCSWCETRLMVPAQYDTWKRQQSSISEYAYS